MNTDKKIQLLSEYESERKLQQIQKWEKSIAVKAAIQKVIS